MKILYNSTDVAARLVSYDQYQGIPFINGYAVTGDLTIGDFYIYDYDAIDNAIASSRAVKIVDRLPITTIANTQYYVGPDQYNRYHIYLYDNDNQQIDMGPADANFYNGGANGIRIDSNMVVSINTGNLLKLTEDNKLTLPLTSDIRNSNNYEVATAKQIWDYVYTGATASTAGKRGFVPDPAAANYRKFLSGGSSLWSQPSSGNGVTTLWVPGAGAEYQLKHSNVVTADGTQRWRMMKFDAQGHITGSTNIGLENNVTSTSATNMLAANQGYILNNKFNNTMAKSEVRDYLGSTETNRALAASKGKILNEKLYNDIENKINSDWQTNHAICNRSKLFEVYDNSSLWIQAKDLHGCMDVLEIIFYSMKGNKYDNLAYTWVTSDGWNYAHSVIGERLQWASGYMKTIFHDHEYIGFYNDGSSSARIFIEWAYTVGK